jgi:hypothetical protein
MILMATAFGEIVLKYAAQSKSQRLKYSLKFQLKHWWKRAALFVLFAIYWCHLRIAQTGW